MSRAPKGQSFHVMAKPGGSICNIDCDYCFFLSKEKLYPEGRHRMSESLLETYIRQLLDCHGGGQVNLAWQGGEPTLLGLEFFRKAIALAEKFRRHDQIILHSIQTNGLLLDDKWCVFLKKKNILVGVSIDGPRAFHDLYRKDKRGQGTFSLVMKAIERLKRHAIDFNVLCTVNSGNQHHGRAVYTFLRDVIGAEWIQFIPVIVRTSDEVLHRADSGWRDENGERNRPLYRQTGDRADRRSVGRREFGHFLIEVFDEWIRHDVARVHVQHFEAMLAVFFGQHLMCSHAPTCGRAVALEHNGDLYCCDHYVEPGYLLGNIGKTPLSTLMMSQSLLTFGNDKRDHLTRQCRSCNVRAFCHGGCPKDRFDENADGDLRQNYLCQGLKAFFTHAMPAMERIASLVREGRSATEIMPWARERKPADHTAPGDRSEGL